MNFIHLHLKKKKKKCTKQKGLTKFAPMYVLITTLKMILSQNNAKSSNLLKKCFMLNGMKILWGQFYLESFIHIFIGIEVSITNDPSSISPTLHSLPCHIILKVFGSTEKVIVERCWLVITYFLPLFFDNGQNHVQRWKGAKYFLLQDANVLLN